MALLVLAYVYFLTVLSLGFYHPSQEAEQFVLLHLEHCDPHF